MTTVLSRAGWAMGTGMGIGLAPLAPATVASLAAVLLYGFSPLDEDSIGFFLLCGLGFRRGGWFSSNSCGRSRGRLCRLGFFRCWLFR